jgi:major membrane immunogen (membrane-anchored lipoprotein)
MKLGIGGKGSRAALQEKLISWHRKRSKANAYSNSPGGDDHPEVENIPMNVVGNNFSMLDMREQVKSLKASSAVWSSFNELEKSVNELKPSRGQWSSKRGILRRNDNSDFADILKSMKSSSRLSFSPFNAVKIIPNRVELKKVTQTLFEEEGGTDDSWMSEYDEDNADYDYYEESELQDINAGNANYGAQGAEGEFDDAAGTQDEDEDLYIRITGQQEHMHEDASSPMEESDAMEVDTGSDAPKSGPSISISPVPVVRAISRGLGEVVRRIFDE